jgi:hypothetical protein
MLLLLGVQALKVVAVLELQVLEQERLKLRLELLHLLEPLQRCRC